MAQGMPRWMGSTSTTRNTSAKAHGKRSLTELLASADRRIDGKRSSLEKADPSAANRASTSPETPFWKDQKKANS